MGSKFFIFCWCVANLFIWTQGSPRLSSDRRHADLQQNSNDEWSGTEYFRETTSKLAGDVVVTETHMSFYGGIKWVNTDVGYAILLSGGVAMTRDSGMNFNFTPIPHQIGVSKIYINNLANTVLFLTIRSTENATSWFTKDGGLTFESIDMVHLTDIQFHPTEKYWALGLRRPQDGGPGPLYISTNFLQDGKTATWNLLRENVENFDWCNAGDSENDLPKERLCLIADDGPSKPSRFMESIDLGHTYIGILDLEVENYIPHSSFMFLIAGKDLYVSNNFGKSFHKAILPSGLRVPFIEPTQILDYRTGAVWLAVNHESWSYLVPHEGNIYVSDREGFKFTLALSNVNSLNNWWDFDAIWSLEGSYLANQLLPWEDGSYVGPNGNVMLKTQITYDNGNHWTSIRAPNNDSTGVPYNCTGFCSLNLYGLTTWLGIGNAAFYGDFYSSQDAVGLVLATGNVGTYLRLTPEEVRTYISRDGGVTWSEILNRSSVYTYGDHGGILCLVPNVGYTDTLYYSLDEGLTLINYTFTPHPVRVNSIWNSDSKGQKFIIKATGESGAIYFGIDFSQMKERLCNDSDYTIWAPENGQCVLGRKVTYLRRIVDADCYSDKSTNHIYNITSCPCTANDYECDYNYQRLSSGACIGSPPDPSTMCPPGQTHYLRTQGYRRIPSDTCTNGLPNYEPVITPCPDTPPSTTGYVTTGSVTGTTSGSISTGTSSATITGTSTGGGGDKPVPGPSGMAPDAVAGLVIGLVVGVGFVAFVLGVIAAFKSSRIRSLSPAAWSRESQPLL